MQPVMRRWLLCLVCMFAWNAGARADSGMLMGGVANRQMPMDAVTAPTACYSERRLRTAYVAAAGGKRIVRASDSTQTDIGFTAYGLPDNATESTFCNSTSCKLVTYYDQCGSRDITQATDGNRYTRQTSGGPGNYFYNQATAGTQTNGTAASVTPATGLVSLSIVANRVTATGGACRWLAENGAAANRIEATSGAAQWRIAGGTSGTLGISTTDNAWHAMNGVINGASSVVNKDGAELSGGTNPTGNTAAAIASIAGAASTTCNQVEAMFWDNYALTAGERAYINNLQHIGFGF